MANSDKSRLEIEMGKVVKNLFKYFRKVKEIKTENESIKEELSSIKEELEDIRDELKNYRKKDE